MCVIIEMARRRMFMRLEEALLRIEELEHENQELRAIIKEHELRKYSGRKKHDEKWMRLYNDFVMLYEAEKTIIEIVKSVILVEELHMI